MGYEYATTRLRGMRARFVPETELESISAGRDLPSVVLLLGDSLFADEIDRLKAGGRETTLPPLMRAIEDGRQAAIRAAARIVNERNPGAFAFVFARMEIEQIKDAMRCIRLGEPVYEKRFGFLALSASPQWTGVWSSFRSLAQFRQFLVKTAHPFARAVDDEAASQPMAELKLERHFFGHWLKSNARFNAECGNYFADLNDMVNLHTCALLRGHVPSSGDPRLYFVKGPGRLRQADFEQMTVLPDMEFRDFAARRTGLTLKFREGVAGFSQTLRQAFLRRWRLAAISRPTGLLEILVFLEELNAMTMNVKLAVAAGAGKKRRSAAMTDYFVLRRLG